MVARSKVRVSGNSLVGIAGSDTAEWHWCPSWVLCIVRWRSLWRADLSSRRVLPSVVCLVWKPRKILLEGPQKKSNLVKNVWRSSADRQDSAYRLRAFCKLSGSWRPCNYFSYVWTEQGSHSVSRSCWTSAPWFRSFHYAACRTFNTAYAYVWVTSLDLYCLYHQQWW